MPGRQGYRPPAVKPYQTPSRLNAGTVAGARKRLGDEKFSTFASGALAGMKTQKPGDLYEKHKATKKKKRGLRPASAVVKSEQNASHQTYKKKKTMPIKAVAKATPKVPGFLRGMAARVAPRTEMYKKKKNKK